MAFLQGTGGGSETPTLLWTNPDTTINFNAQTVSIDLTNYQCLIIKTLGIRGENLYTFQYINKNEGSAKLVAAYSGNNARVRPITSINDSGITFASGDSVAYVIPVEIYGMKKALL